MNVMKNIKKLSESLFAIEQNKKSPMKTTFYFWRSSGLYLNNTKNQFFTVWKIVKKIQKVFLLLE